MWRFSGLRKMPVELDEFSFKGISVRPLEREPGHVSGVAEMVALFALDLLSLQSNIHATEDQRRGKHNDPDTEIEFGANAEA